MMITKKHLPRRTFLKGAGVALGLPLLDSMIPALATAAESKSPRRLTFIYLPNGIMMEQWTPASEGKDFKITNNQSTVRAGTEIRVKSERPEVAISLSEMAKDSWVIFELPGYATATSGKQQDSLDALRKATETSYFKGPDAVWVKLVIPIARKGVGRDQFGPSDTQTSIVVSR